MIVSQAQLHIGNYDISIAQDDHGHVYCFKHDQGLCDWEFFENLELATDFIFQGLPKFKYVVKQKDSE